MKTQHLTENEVFELRLATAQVIATALLKNPNLRMEPDEETGKLSISSTSIKIGDEILNKLGIKTPSVNPNKIPTGWRVEEAPISRIIAPGRNPMKVTIDKIPTGWKIAEEGDYKEGVSKRFIDNDWCYSPWGNPLSEETYISPAQY
jgi:uncharacterized protein YbdZ (MbtH family)